MTGRLENKVAIITGGNGGIGLGMADAMGMHGAKIIVAARNNDKNLNAISHLKS